MQCRIDVRSVVGVDASQECLDRLAEPGQVVTEHLDEPLVPAQVPAGQVEVEAADPRRDHGQAEPGPDGVEVGRQRRQLQLADGHGSELGEQRDVPVRPLARLWPEDAQGAAGPPVGVDQWHPEVRAETAGRRRHHRCHPPVAGRVVDDERTTGAGGECAQQLRQVAAGAGPLGVGGEVGQQRHLTRRRPEDPRRERRQAVQRRVADQLGQAAVGRGDGSRLGHVAGVGQARRSFGRSPTGGRLRRERVRDPFAGPSVTHQRVCVTRTSARPRTCAVGGTPRCGLNPNRRTDRDVEPGGDQRADGVPVRVAAAGEPRPDRRDQVLGPRDDRDVRDGRARRTGPVRPAGARDAPRRAPPQGPAPCTSPGTARRRRSWRPRPVGRPRCPRGPRSAPARPLAARRRARAASAPARSRRPGSQWRGSARSSVRCPRRPSHTVPARSASSSRRCSATPRASALAATRRYAFANRGLGRNDALSGMATSTGSPRVNAGGPAERLHQGGVSSRGELAQLDLA